MWRFLVKNQQIEILEREIIASDQIQFVCLRFVFEGQWKKLHKVVQFTQCDETFNRVLGFDGLSCYLPAEIHPGTAKMSVFGYDTDNIKALRATTVPVTLHIRDSGFMSDGNIPPTPDLYQQLISEMKNHHGSDGKSGMSAYEIAVTNGFDGSEEEWLKSLKGSDGTNGLSAYELAVQQGFDGTIEEWLKSLKGEDGKDAENGQNGTNGNDGMSAFEIALRNGFEGSETEWLESLKGSDGTNGTDGTNGINGLSAFEIAVKNGFEGREAEWLESLKGTDGIDGTSGINGLSAYEIAVGNGFAGTEAEWLESLKGHDGTNGSDGTNGNNGLSAYEIAVKNGFTGIEAEWLESLKGRDGTSEDLSGIKENMFDFQSGLDEMKYEVQLHGERLDKLEQDLNGVDFFEFQETLDELKYTSQMDRERISKLEDNSTDIAELNAELSKYQQLLDALKYDIQTYEERIIALENKNISSGYTVFSSGGNVLSEYGETIYTFYNDGYRSLSGFAQSYSDFCSPDNDYALNFNYNDFSWGGVVYVMFLKPFYIKSSDKLSVTYLSGATDDAEIFLIRKDNQSMSYPDLARYIHEQITEGYAVQIPFKWLYSDDYITQLIDLSQYSTAEYYLAVKGVSDNTHPKIKELKIREG